MSLDITPRLTLGREQSKTHTSHSSYAFIIIYLVPTEIMSFEVIFQTRLPPPHVLFLQNERVSN